MSEFVRRGNGQSIFVLGNGPSLAETPVEKLPVTFAMNKIATLPAYVDGWRPTYYWCTTGGLKNFPEPRRLAEVVIGDRVTSFVSTTSPLPDRENVYRVKTSSRRANFSINEEMHFSIPLPVWSDDPLGGLIHYRMTMYDMMQMICWMGFNPIYLVGCDLGFSPEQHHYDGYIDGVVWSRQRAYHENWWHYRAHEWINYYTSQRGIKVYNATLGGELEVYERVNLNDLLCRNWLKP